MRGLEPVEPARLRRLAMTPTEFNRLLERLNLTQAEAAARLGVSRTTVNAWSCGRHRIPKTKVVLVRAVLVVSARKPKRGRA